MPISVFRIVIASILSLVAMLIFVRLVGNRQVNQMNFLDYINGITVGSIAAEIATDLEGELWPGFLAIAVYAVIAIFINYACCKSNWARHLFEGSPLVLFQNGNLYQNNLLKARLNVHEFLTQCRMAGYFDLSQIDTAVLETNGQISFLPKSSNRPATPADLGKTPAQEKPWITLIVDGSILKDKLSIANVGEGWLLKQLEKQNITVEETFLAMYDGNNELFVCPRTQSEKPNKLFN